MLRSNLLILTSLGEFNVEIQLTDTYLAWWVECCDQTHFTYLVRWVECWDLRSNPPTLWNVMSPFRLPYLLKEVYTCSVWRLSFLDNSGKYFVWNSLNFVFSIFYIYSTAKFDLYEQIRQPDSHVVWLTSQRVVTLYKRQLITSSLRHTPNISTLIGTPHTRNGNIARFWA